MAEFGLIEPFDVDHGELDGLTPAQCFTLGVEWERFCCALYQSNPKTGEKKEEAQPFAFLCNERNAERLIAMAERHGRFCEQRTKHDGWTEIIIGGSK